MSRHRLSTVLLVVTTVLSLVAVPLVWTSTVLTDEDAFVAVATDVIEQPAVREAIAGDVAILAFDALITNERLAAALPAPLRPLIAPLAQVGAVALAETAVEALSTDRPAEGRDAALRELHRQVTDGSGDPTIDLRAVLVSTSRAVAGVAAGAGVAVVVAETDRGIFPLSDLGPGVASLVEVLASVPGWARWVAALMVAAGLGAIVAAVDRRRAMIGAGLALVSGSLIGVVVCHLVLGALLGGTEVGQSVAEVVAADIAAQQWGIQLVGGTLILVGLMLSDSPAVVALRALPGQVWRRDDTLAGTVGAILGDDPVLPRVIVWTAGIAAVVLWPQPTPRVLLSIVALVALALVACRHYGGETPSATGRVRVNLAALSAVALLVWPAWSPAMLPGALLVVAVPQVLADGLLLWRGRERAGRTPVVTRVAHAGRRLLPAAAVLVVAVVVAGFLTTDSVEAIPDDESCNGDVALCDRPLDEVVFAGSHNSMSSSDLGWDLALQTGDIIDQLDHGVRALLIDTHYWSGEDTISAGADAESKAVIEAALSDDVPQPGTWLCHGMCALGASSLPGTLAEIDLWLDAHPREVLMFVVQDEISTADTVVAFEESGLIDRVHAHEPGTPWPTLAELIEADERVVVYAENEGEADSWYQNAWETAFTETPYTFSVPADFTCTPNRGQPDNELFLINHWITSGIPVREAAVSVNSREVLLDRVRDCEEERGRLPTVLAVDFVETGDLVEVVAELNSR